MKLKVEIKPKEWFQLALFILVVYLIICGKAEDAVKMISLWFEK